MRRTIRWALAAVLAALPVGQSCAAADDWQLETRDGVRSAIVMPVRQAHAPTLIVLHGATISASLTARWSGFAEAAAAQGFAAVFPEGIYRLWNDGRGDGLSSSDDVDFLRRLNEELVKRGVADPARIYIAGISNGGMMTLRMLCEAPEQYAGAATVIANMPAEAGAACRLRKPMPVIMFNGTADPLVPYKGGGVGLTGSRGNVWPAERTAAFIARANGCSGPAERPAGGADSDQIKVMRLDWSACSSGQAVTLYRVEGGGHQLYGHTNILPMIFGPGTDLVSAPQTIMAMFAKERR
ncbi:MAG: prolyl oligopeptidase family serine peptidase [Hyphomonadaceae bacterium]|jgi:polyhydroxybutyrate depolymerase|nr:prolyl oligopeptidase family serine peptidase [Hyphomonadaceae bacterium]